MENKNIDNINNPNHYKLSCGVESIEIIKRVLGLRGFVAFCLGNILKYLIRAEKKNGEEEIYETTLEIINKECVECCRCENNGNYIQDIAEWEEEDERD